MINFKVTFEHISSNWGRKQKSVLTHNPDLIRWSQPPDRPILQFENVIRAALFKPLTPAYSSRFLCKPLCNPPPPGLFFSLLGPESMFILMSLMPAPLSTSGGKMGGLCAAKLTDTRNQIYLAANGFRDSLTIMEQPTIFFLQIGLRSQRQERWHFVFHMLIKPWARYEILVPSSSSSVSTPMQIESFEILRVEDARIKKKHD